MAISARLSHKVQLALIRYCKAHGLTKTEALERGIDLLVASEGGRAGHPAFAAYERLRPRLAAAAPKDALESIDSIKRSLDEKYPH